MDRKISNLILYKTAAEDSVLADLCSVFKQLRLGQRVKPSEEQDRSKDKEVMKVKLHDAVNHIMGWGVSYGIEGNLWQHYLTFLLMTDENPFSLACERRKAATGTLGELAKRDMTVFSALFSLDFSPIEKELQTDCFSLIENCKGMPVTNDMQRQNTGKQLQRVSRALAAAKTPEEMLQVIAGEYSQNGTGIFGLHRSFRISIHGDEPELVSAWDQQQISFNDLIGYNSQKRQLRSNTESFLAGNMANNVLLYGDSGTGKSSGVRALLTEYGGAGLRIIEIYKHQFRWLSQVIDRLSERNYKFIIFIDDLSFEENEFEYKYFKAVMDGGMGTLPKNLLIYATSNRRHIIKETWKDKEDMEHDGEIHRSDTVEEKLSLAARFGLLINYSAPNREDFLEIVEALADRQGITMNREELFFEANRWEIRHGGLSGRTAQQFLNYLKTKKYFSEK